MTDLKIPLLRRKNVVGYTIVEERDGWVASWRWRVDGRGYVLRKEGTDPHSRQIFLHREITGLKHGDKREVDHINGDKLDNRRENLRVVTRAQNGQNVASQRNASSSHRGVSFYKQTNCWVAFCGVNGQKVHLGYHKTELEAAKAASAFRAQHLPFTNEARHLEEVLG